MGRLKRHGMLDLVGRSPEMTQLAAVLELGTKGSGGIAFIEGEPGIGKSRLLDEVLDRARHLGFAVFKGAAEELEGTRPFGALVQALGPLEDTSDSQLSEIQDLYRGTFPPFGRPGEMPDLGYRLIDLAVGFLEGVTSTQPVVLALEDLHWADPGTLRAVNSFVRRARDTGMILLATWRPVPRARDLERLVDHAISLGAKHLILKPLSDEAVTELAEAAIGSLPAPSLKKQLDSTGGNPLFVIELLRALDEEGAIEVMSDRAEALAAPLPPDLRLTILRRLSFLSEESLELLRMASILGSSFSIEDLSLITRSEPRDLLASLEEPLRAGILDDAAPKLAFRHDLIREAIYEDLPASIRVAFHLDAARSLASAGAGATRVAEHFALGASLGDKEAIGWLRKAGREVHYLAPPVAVEFGERALALTAPGDPERDALISELVMPLVLSGKTAQAEALAEETLSATPTPEVEYAVRRALAYSALTMGNSSSALEQFQIVTKMTHVMSWAKSPEADHAIDLANLGISQLYTGDINSSRSTAEEALALAKSQEDDFAECIALIPLTILASAEGLVDRAIESGHRGFSVASRGASAHYGNLWSHLYYSLALLDGDRLGEAEIVLRSGLQLAEEQGRVSQLSFYHMGVAATLLHSGQWEDARAEYETALALSEETGSAFVVLAAAAGLALIAIHGDELDRAERLLSEAETPMAGGHLMGFDLAMTCHALLLEARGRSRDSFSVMRSAWEIMQPFRYLLAGWRLLAPRLVRLALIEGERELAVSVVGEAEEGARRAGAIPSAEGAALRCRGLLEGDPGILINSVEAYRKGPRAWDRGLACEDAARLLAEAGRLDEARPFFEEALDVYEHLGAVRSAAGASASMRERGLRRGSRSPRARPSRGWESLTPTELKVAGLLSGGLTNNQIAERLFVSRYTVETHLKHIFGKLEMTSRAEVAAEATRRGADRARTQDP